MGLPHVVRRPGPRITGNLSLIPCYSRDAICSPDACASIGSTTETIHPASHSGEDDEDDPQTHRLQPPLRVVNVSKLSAFFDADTLKTRKSWNPASSTPTTGVTLDRNGYSEQSSSLASYNNPLRSAPLVPPPAYGQRPSLATDTSLRRRSKSVPSSPSIANLGSMTLVQQRLAKFESVREVGSRQTLREEERCVRGYLTVDPTTTKSNQQAAQSHEQSLGRTATQMTRTTIGGLTTPPTSPQKGGFSHLARQATAQSYASFATPLPSPVRKEFGETASASDCVAKDYGSAPPTERAVGRSYRLPLNDVVVPSFSPGEIAPLNLSNTQTQPSLQVSPWKLSAPPLTRQWSTATTSRDAPPTSEYRLSAITSIPSHDFPDIAPLFALVRDTAVEQAALVRVLAGRLDDLREDVKDFKDGKEKGSFTSSGAAAAVGTNSRVSRTGSISNAEVSPASGQVLEDIHSKLEALASPISAPPPAMDLTRIETKLDGLRNDDLPQHLDTLSAVRAKIDKLDEVQKALTGLSESGSADRKAWSQRLDGLAGSVQAISLDGLTERLDGMRASLAVLEAVAQTNRPSSAFRNTPAAGSSSFHGPAVDLSSLHTKLDALASNQGRGATGSSGDEKLDSLMALLKESIVKTEAKGMIESDRGSGADGKVPDGDVRNSNPTRGWLD